MTTRHGKPPTAYRSLQNLRMSFNMIALKLGSVMDRRYSNSLFLLGIIAVLTVLLEGCGGFRPAPPPPCPTAPVCARVVSDADQSCLKPWSWSNTNAYLMANNNPTRKIFVSYQILIRHLNTLRPDDKGSGIVGVDPKGRTVLGCERTPNTVGASNDAFDEWSYTITDACFADQCPAPPVTKPSKPRPPNLTCEQLCSQNHPSCLKYKFTDADPLELKLGDALKALNNNILSSVVNVTTPPAHVKLKDLVDLSNLFTGTKACFRDDLLVDRPAPTDYPFSSSGATCPVGFSLNDPRASMIEVSFPGYFGGMMQLTANVSFKMDAQDDAHAPTLMVVEQPSNTAVYEPIISILGRPTRLTFTGEKSYCAQLLWGGEEP